MPQLLPEFAARPSGLLVPQRLAREREVWTKEDRKLLDRAVRMAAAHDCSLVLLCRDARCIEQPQLRVERDELGHRLLVCGHKTREVRER